MRPFVLKKKISNQKKEEKKKTYSKNENFIKVSNNKKDLIKYNLKFIYGKINQNNYNILKTQELENLLNNQIYEEEFFNIRTITEMEIVYFLFFCISYLILDSENYHSFFR